MPKTSIYLPDDLAEQVRRYALPMSEIVQNALRKAVETARLKEKLMNDLDAVVARLRGDIVESESAERAEGHSDGMMWARRYASVKDLELLPELDGHGEGLLAYFSAKDNANVVSIDIDDEPYWLGFQEGAQEIWDAVASKL